MSYLQLFFKGVENKYGEHIFVPTMAGYIAVVAIIILALVVASYVIGKKNAKISTKQLTVTAVCVALAFVTSNIKFFKLPFGGSITLFSMLFICLIGYWYGIGAGVLSGVAFGLLALIVDPYILTLPQMLVDYPLAFGALGLSGIGYHVKKEYQIGFLNFNGLHLGYILGVLGRYFSAFISGYLFFASYAPEGWKAVPYSLAYNGIYLGVEAAITLVVLIVPQIVTALGFVKNQLHNY